MKTRDTEYLYASMRIRSLEKSLIGDAELDALISADSVDDIIKILTSLGYEKLDEGIDAALSNARDRAFSLIRSLSPNPAICDVFMIKYDYHNLKVILKSAASGAVVDRLFVDAGRFSPNALKNAVQQGDFSDVPNVLRDAVQQASETLARTNDACLCDFILDAACFEEMKAAADASGSDFLRGYIALYIDAQNLRATLRARRSGKDVDFLKRALISGGNIGVGKFIDVLTDNASFAELFVSSPLEDAALSASLTGGLTAFERKCDDALIYYLRRAKYIPFGAETLIAYLAAVEADIMTIRIIVAGKAQGIGEEEIGERLRASYV